MKELIQDFYESKFPGGTTLTRDVVIELMIEVWNAAIKQAAEEAETKDINGPHRYERYDVVDKDSILKLLIKESE